MQIPTKNVIDLNSLDHVAAIMSRPERVESLNTMMNRLENGTAQIVFLTVKLALEKMLRENGFEEPRKARLVRTSLDEDGVRLDNGYSMVTRAVGPTRIEEQPYFMISCFVAPDEDAKRSHGMGLLMEIDETRDFTQRGPRMVEYISRGNIGIGEFINPENMKKYAIVTSVQPITYELRPFSEMPV